MKFFNKITVLLISVDRLNNGFGVTKKLLTKKYGPERLHGVTAHRRFKGHCRHSILKSEHLTE